MNTHIVPTGFEVKAKFRQLVMQIEREYEPRIRGAERETAAKLRNDMKRKLRKETIRVALQMSHRNSWEKILR